MDTLAELREMLWSSAYVQANPSKAYKNAYNDEYVSIAQYFSGGNRPDISSYSKLGRVLVGLEDHRRLQDEHTPAPTPAPPPTGKLLGLVPGNNIDSAKAKQCAPQCMRVGTDHALTDAQAKAFIDWCEANGAKPLLLANEIDKATTLSWLSRHPRFKECELDNEPYFGGVDLPAWSVKMRDTAKAIKATYPNVRTYVPLLTQTNGGDYLVGGQWKPWVTTMLDAAPDLPQYVDGWAIHPYTAAKGLPPSFATVDKVKSQLAARNAVRPFYVTEIGWSVGTGTGANQVQVTASQQAQYLKDFITTARSRGDIQDIYVYHLLSWGTGYEASFGVFNPDGSKRPAVDTIKSLV